MRPSIHNCKIIPLPTVRQERGSLTFIQDDTDRPFQIERVFWVYGVPGGSERGGHAHKNLQEIIVPAAGAFEVTLDDGATKESFVLDRPDEGLLVTEMIWRDLTKFSRGAVCLVLASAPFDESDYVRSYSDFLSLLGNS